MIVITSCQIEVGSLGLWPNNKIYGEKRIIKKVDD
jgi:hypothetical protein